MSENHMVFIVNAASTLYQPEPVNWSCLCLLNSASSRARSQQDWLHHQDMQCQHLLSEQDTTVCVSCVSYGRQGRDQRIQPSCGGRSVTAEPFLSHVPATRF